MKIENAPEAHRENSQFSILNSQFSILNSVTQFSILNSQFSIPSLNSQFSIPSSRGLHLARLESIDERAGALREGIEVTGGRAPRRKFFEIAATKNLLDVGVVQMREKLRR